MPNDDDQALTLAALLDRHSRSIEEMAALSGIPRKRFYRAVAGEGRLADIEWQGIARALGQDDWLALRAAHEQSLFPCWSCKAPIQYDGYCPACYGRWREAMRRRYGRGPWIPVDRERGLYTRTDRLVIHFGSPRPQPGRETSFR